MIHFNMSNFNLEIPLEIDENERYWLGKGFSKGGLLPNDRGCFSAVDGSLSWNTLEEIDNEDHGQASILIGRGWKLKEDSEWTIASDWMYAIDCKQENIRQAKPKKGMMHFVRYRRHTRLKVFQPQEIVSDENIYSKCEHCDSEAVENVSKLLLEVVSYASLLHNAKEFSLAVGFPLKYKLLDACIQFESHSKEDARTSLQTLSKVMENWIETEQSQTAMRRLFSGVDFSFRQGQAGHPQFLQRCREVSESSCFPEVERSAIAGLLVRKIDADSYQLHCDKPGCGTECRFAPVSCTNEGCNRSISRLHLKEHDEVCLFKQCSCECGEVFVRGELQKHQTQACKLREVACPFEKIGCSKRVRACDLEQHVADDNSWHLLQAMTRMMEYEEVLRNMKQTQQTLIQQNKELRDALKSATDSMEKTMSTVDAKMIKTTKELRNLESTCKKEFKYLRQKPQQLR